MKWTGSPKAAIVPKGNAALGERLQSNGRELPLRVGSALEGVGREQDTRALFTGKEYEPEKRKRLNRILRGGEEIIWWE